MSTPTEHVEEAERLLTHALAESIDSPWKVAFIAEAQVQATLAVAVATDDLAASFAQHFPASS